MNSYTITTTIFFVPSDIKEARALLDKGEHLRKGVEVDLQKLSYNETRWLVSRYNLKSEFVLTQLEQKELEYYKWASAWPIKVLFNKSNFPRLWEKFQGVLPGGLR